jgi:GNAT superfamily N-acetyltransferase
MLSNRVDRELQQPTSRALRDDADVGQIRELLLATYPLTAVDWNWEIRRWDGWRYHKAGAAWDPRWQETVRLWETDDGRVVGAVHSEDGGDAHLQIHPDYRHMIEEEMFAWAEEHLAAVDPQSGSQRLETFVFDYDMPRRQLLAERGYEQTTYGGVSRRLRLGKRPLPTPLVAEGYTMRTTRPGALHDQQGIADILNAAFQRTIHSAAEIAAFSIHSPSFRHDLDLVAVAPDNTFAAYVGFTFDERNGRGIVEPVCTHPAHRRLGLARALLIEGLWRVRELGAVDVYVGTGDDVGANRFYDAVGFTEAYRGRIWQKNMA